MIAIPTNSTVAAAVWPEGKLDVDGVELRRTTDGRGRADDERHREEHGDLEEQRQHQEGGLVPAPPQREEPHHDRGPENHRHRVEAAVANFVTSFQPLVRLRAK